MWWKLKKIIDDEKQIVYRYSRESDELDGEVAFDKENKTFHCIKLASGDTERGVEWFYPHLWRTISKENAPDEHFIAIG
ncbi:MAG: hypothetical protein RR651_04895 [Lysinibacillus sp.]